MNARVGIGHDTHRLVEGRPLILGGVTIPFERGLLGHSDADVVFHALADALLGAAGLGDIGELFPDTDPKWKGLDSGLIVAEACRAVAEAGWRPVNCDVTVHAQRPKLGPYKAAIRGSVAKAIGLPESAVNVKAKTGEQVGPVGREEAILADAVVLLTASAE
jgi:2-C-methyl-D-erythritol 2,4-cyclodiphosphate synthase